MNTAWCKITGGGAINRAIALLIVASALLCNNAVAGTMTVATGGGAISADTTSAAGGTGAWTALTGPSYLEVVKADLSVGTVILTAPAGFEFNTAATVTVQLIAGDATANKNINKTAIGGTVATATVTATTISWNVNFQSAGTTMDQVTWLGVQVRPTAGTPLATGNIIPSGTSGIGGSAASAGTLTEVAGAVSAAVSTVAASPASVAADGVTISTVTVTLKDRFGNPVSGKTVTLTAGTGSSIISAASGASNASGVVTFTVRDSVGEAVTYTARDTTDGITITQTATVTFIAVVSSFNAVEPASNAVTGKIFTKVAGQNFALDIVALDASNAIATGFTGAVIVEVVDNTSGGGVCASMTVIATFTNQTFIAGDTGRHPLSSPNTVADVWPNAKVRIKYPAGLPTVISCSGDNFAIRPSGFGNVSVTDSDWQTAGITRILNNVVAATTPPVHKAGQPLTLRATALNSAAATTTNYTGTPSTVLSACVGTACTATFGTFSMGAGTAVAGVINSTTATYSEAGAFSLQLQDQTFASVDAADGTAANCAGRYVCSAALNVGRFVPDHFALSVASITNRAALTCPACTFTYMGEQLNAVFTMTAQSAGNATTLNYTGALAKLVPTTAVPVGSGGPLGLGMVDNGTPVVPFTVCTATPAHPCFTPGTATAGSFANGVATGITVPLTVYRGATAVGPFAALDIGIAPTDSDGVTMSAYDLNADAVAGNDHSKVARTEVRYGRMKISNAHGSELLPLPITMTAQYWDGTAYVTNTLDNSSSFPATLGATGVVDSNYQKNLNLGETSVITPPASVVFVNGVAGYRLAAPGANNNGSVDMTVNALSAYLPVGSAARATFGVYKGANQFIYQRENY